MMKIMPNRSVRLAMTFFCLLLFAKLVEKNVLFPRFDERHAARIQKIFIGKEQLLLQHIDMLVQTVQTNKNDSRFIDFHEKHGNNLKKQGLYFFVYQNDSLVYWSAKNVAVPDTYSSSEFDKPYVSLGKHSSGKYASFTKKGDGYVVVGLTLIKNVHQNENKYLKTSFQKDFGLPDKVKISQTQAPDGYPITDSNGQFMWSLIFDSTCSYEYQIYLPALAYLLAFLVLFMFLDSIFGILRTSVSKNLYLPVLALILVLIRFVMQHWQIPDVFYELKIFTPDYFGSELFPSLGELYLWCIFIFFFIIELYRFLTFPSSYERQWKYFAYVGLSLMVTIIAFFSIAILLKALVINSRDVFEETNRMLLPNGISLFGYSIILFFFVTFCLLLNKAIQLCKQELTFYRLVILYIITLSLVIIGWSMAGLYISLTSVFFLSVLVILMGNLQLRRTVKFRYSHYILLVFILSLFTSIYINRYNYEKFEDRKRVLVTNLASQHDLTAEFLLRSISERIISDIDALADIVYKDSPVSTENALNYFKRQHFYSSYWNRYVFKCYICDYVTPLKIDQQITVNCVSHFRNMTETIENQLTRSQFWYIDRPDIWSYLGWFRVDKAGELPLHVFIELWPDIISDAVGYPELLLDERLVTGNNLKGYSYAKYLKNRKVDQYGDYRYSLTDDIFQTDPNDYHTVYTDDDMEHIVYRPDENNIVVLSSNSHKPSDAIINFSYIFIFFFIVVSIGLLIFHLPAFRRGFQWNFRNKIQYSMIAIMIVSFAVIGGFTVFYVNQQYQSKNDDILKDKMRAIHTELSNILLFQNNMNEGQDNNWDIISELLSDLQQHANQQYQNKNDDILKDKIETIHTELSNILLPHNDMNEDNDNILAKMLSDLQRLFSTEINLFDVRGQLIATSFPDIFNSGIMGRQISPNAYINLVFKQQPSILENEKIGGLHYISAYKPFVDSENRIIAFLNLPYFTQQDALTEEISNVIMSLLNFYMVIILITVIVSVVMSNQITQPLLLLQEKFRNIKLGEKNDPIHYQSRDELGGLVKEYNRAIEELARSASRLARSERESAWREMARQIAHEINNPLTPMKLSVQHLKKAYDNKSERFNEYMEKISRSLVEQIDALSAIATEFSDFAKMPAAHNERIDLIDQINTVVPLFAINENKRAFHTDFHGLKQAMIYADKEQMSRVFINLFKNALQAIPKDRQAEINIDVLKINRILWVRVKDNGMGIPEEMQGKMFRPNFTTKSSGMGVGLSIVHSIIEGTGGSINFKTRKGEGTTFIISLPATV